MFIRWAQFQKEAVTEEAVELEYGGEASQVLGCSPRLKSELTGCCVCDRADDGNDLEAMRQLTNRYEPRTAMPKRARFKPITNGGPSFRALGYLLWRSVLKYSWTSSRKLCGGCSWPMSSKVSMSGGQPSQSSCSLSAGRASGRPRFFPGSHSGLLEV